ncbi:MAG TPA: glycosyltransferase family 1 protein [Chitinophagaceae bacterium]
MKPAIPIKIFVDAHVFDQEYQGTRTFIKELYARLAQKQNIQLYLAAHNIDQLKAIFGCASNIVYIRYKTTSSWPRLLYTIPSILKEYDIDFAHFQYMIPPLNNNKCQYIVTIHDVIFAEYPEEFSLCYRLSKKMLYQLAASKAAIITTVSAFSRNSIEKRLGVPPGKTKIISNGVSNVYFKPYNKERAAAYIAGKYGVEKYILYVSRFEPRKNHAGLLKAYLELQLYRKGYYLVLLGHQSLSVDEFNSLLHELPAGIRKFIFINDAINDEELLEFYRAATLFVYPSKAEGFGISPLEAAALKIPVLCSNASAMQEFTFFGDQHFNTADHELLTKKLNDILCRPPGEATLQGISDFIRMNYSWEESAEKFYQLIRHQQQLISATKQKTNDKLFAS